MHGCTGFNWKCHFNPPHPRPASFTGLKMAYHIKIFH
jgi:hypothetical protein